MADKRKYIEVFREPEGDIPLDQCTKEQLLRCVRSQANEIDRLNLYFDGMVSLRKSAKKAIEQIDSIQAIARKPHESR